MDKDRIMDIMENSGPYEGFMKAQTDLKNTGTQSEKASKILKFFLSLAI